MKLAKKITTLLLGLCLIVPCFSMVSHAAEGKLMFTDPETAVGETVEVKGVVEVAPTLGLEDITINLTYDTTMLTFVSAEEVTESEPGKLTFSRIGIENPNRVEYLMHFTAVAEGTTTIDVVDCNVWTTSDEKVYPVLGNSTVTIAAGEAPTTDVPTDEPTDEPAAGDVVINISDTTSITLLNEISHITLPQRYLATTIKVNEIEFPAWQDTEKANLCILYALNSNGETALYQYDTNERTYQRFEAPAVDEKEEKDSNSIINVLGEVFQDNLDYVVLGTGIGFILFVIIILVLSIKLYNRNAELDELYEEYGLFEEEEAKEEKPVKVEKEEKSVKTVKVIPVKKKENEEFVDIKEEIEDDIIIASDDDLELEDDEIEVEFFEAEPVKEVVAAPVQSEIEKALMVEEQKEDEDEYYDDEDLDIDFEVDFIDLDD